MKMERTKYKQNHASNNKERNIVPKCQSDGTNESLNHEQQKDKTNGNKETHNDKETNE